MRIANPEQMELFEAEKVAPNVERFVGDLGKQIVYIPGGYKGL